MQQDPRLFGCQYMQAKEEDKAGVAKIDNIKSPTIKKSGTEGGAERERGTECKLPASYFGFTKTILRQKQSGWFDCAQNNVNKYLNATYSYIWVGIKSRHSYNKVRGIRGQLVQEDVRVGLEANQPGGLLATGSDH